MKSQLQHKNISFQVIYFFFMGKYSICHRVQKHSGFMGFKLTFYGRKKIPLMWGCSKGLVNYFCFKHQHSLQLHGNTLYMNRNNKRSNRGLMLHLISFCPSWKCFSLLSSLTSHNLLLCIMSLALVVLLSFCRCLLNLQCNIFSV